VGVWKSWQKEGLDIKDIVWPGNSHTPPQGVPEKFHLKITFLEEPPYINLAPPDPVTGKCSMDRGVLCRVASDAEITEWYKSVFAKSLTNYPITPVFTQGANYYASIPFWAAQDLSELVEGYVTLAFIRPKACDFITQWASDNKFNYQM
ncbi:NMDA receptor 2, partial [Carabus blaptoides fortunei]